MKTFILYYYDRRDKVLMKRNELFLGSILLLISGIYYYMTTKLPEKAALYPTFVVSILAVLSIMFIIKTLISKEKNNEKKIFDGFQVKQFIFILLMSVAYVGLMSVVGYFTTTFLFLIISLFGLKANKMHSIYTSIGFSIFIFIIFKMLLNVPLPRGIIF